MTTPTFTIKPTPTSVEECIIEAKRVAKQWQSCSWFSYPTFEEAYRVALMKELEAFSPEAKAKAAAMQQAIGVDYTKSNSNYIGD